jgi:carboxypeptidase Q
MARRFTAILCFCAFALALVSPIWPATNSPAAGSQSDGTASALEVIAGQGMMHSRAYQYLTELSDDIGARVTGTPAANAAIGWGMEKMKAIGLANVHTEKWQLASGWQRVSADAELVSPLQRRLMVDSMGWVGSTPAGGAEAEVVAVNAYGLKNEGEKNAAQWNGKILILVTKGERPANGFGVFLQMGAFLKAAYAAHAIAVIGGQGGRSATGMHLTHTGVLGFDTFYDIPVVSMASEDQQQIERFLDRGKTVRLKINVQNRVTSGPVESANVIGEIPGTEHPEQIVVVGGHLDSWDLASGATDNGVGTCTTLAAADAIVRSGFKPKRTLRFILFTGEEEGEDGSFNYVKQHQAEMANHVAAVILDNGQGPVTTLQLGGRDDLVDVVKPFASSLQSFGKIDVTDENEFGTDTGAFIVAGLPGISLDQDSPDYKYTHHSPVDTLDKVDPKILDQDATVMGLTAFWIADRPDRLASPWPRDKTAHMLVEKHDDTLLKAFNLWPFGDMK